MSGYIVMDNSAEGGGNFGPGTVFHYYETQREARREYPGALMRSELGFGEIIDGAVIIPEGEHD